MREKILMTLSRWQSNHPWRMLLVVILITLILAGFASQMKITMRVSELLPQKDPRVKVFNDIIEEFATATNLAVVVQGSEDQIKSFADQLAPRILQLRDTTHNQQLKADIKALEQEIREYEAQDKAAEIEALRSEIKTLQQQINFKLFQRVDYKAETEFLRNHALMLVKAADLKNTQEMFTDPNLSGMLTNLNDAMEKEYVYGEEALSTRQKEEQAVGFLDGIQNLVVTLQKSVRNENISQNDVHKTVDKLLIGDPYFISYDKSALIMNVIPNFTLYDRDYIQVSTELVQEQVDQLLSEYPEVRAGLSGGIAREHDEQTYAQQSFQYTTLIALAAILVLLIIAFRMWVAPIFAVINLFLGLIWAIGMAYIFVGHLNLVTSMMSVIILGLGIDFSIHLISQFTEWRAAGDHVSVALEKTFLKSGKGIITGALTTACAFLALIINRSQGMQEMGVVAGVGLLSVMLTTFLFLPAMLVLRESRLDRKRAQHPEKSGRIQRDISFRFLGRVGKWLNQRYIFTVIISFILSGLLIWSGLQIQYDQNYMRMEPEGLTSIALMDTVQEKFDLSMEYALCLANSVAESRQLSEKYRDLSMVAMTDDISVYLPSEEEQQKRIPLLQEIRERIESVPLKRALNPKDLPRIIDQVQRLEMNVIEIQDMAFIGGQDKVDNKCKYIVGDPEKPDSRNIIHELIEYMQNNEVAAVQGLSQLQWVFAPYYQESVLSMCSLQPIQLPDLPASILDQYANKSRDKFMITIYPEGNLYADAAMLDRFYTDVTDISKKTTGTPILGVAMIEIFARDGRNAIIMTLCIVFILLWIDFRKPHYALIAMIPLALGVFWMVGIMNLAGLMLNFMTFIGFPLIIGIGIDDGVHIMHRWQHEGYGKIGVVFSSTGKAISLTSLTTMLAFGSMIFSIFPAWKWFGHDLVIGVGACFITTVLILPGIFGLLKNKN